MGRSRGFTLIETMIALSIAGMLALLAIPRLRSGMLQNNLRSARGSVVMLFQQAKMRAVQETRTVTLNFDNATGAVWITAKPRRSAGTATCGCDTVGTVQNLTTRYGVTLSVTPDASKAFVFDPRGIGDRGNEATTVRLIKSDYRDSVFVSKFGDVSR